MGVESMPGNTGLRDPYDVTIDVRSLERVVQPILYQCPYEKAAMCAMEDGCNGCEEWAIAVEAGKIKTNE